MIEISEVIFLGVTVSVSILDNSPLLERTYRLIALDLDGTLLRSDKTISPLTKEVLKKAQDKGFYIVVATGRHPYSAQRYLEQLDALNEKSCAIVFNGACEVSIDAYIKAHSEIDFPVLNAECALGPEIREITALAHENGCKVHAYSRDRGLLIEDHNPYSKREIDHGQVSFTEVDFTKVKDEERFFKILIVGPKEQIDYVRPIVGDRFSKRFAVMRSDPNFLEFIPGPSSKGTALKALAKSLGVDLSECVAFGDAENDEEMLKNAGLGIAMGNADPGAKEACDIVTLSNDEDGIAIAVQKLLDNQG